MIAPLGRRVFGARPEPLKAGDQSNKATRLSHLIHPLHLKSRPLARMKSRISRSSRLQAAGGAALLLFVLAHSAFAAPLSLNTFKRLSEQCAPHIAVETTAPIARTESGFNAFALHDNTADRGIIARSLEEAVALATDLIQVRQHSVDLGLMQINSANLARLGLTITDAFDPCRSLAAADRLLVAGYDGLSPGGDQQQAVYRALSRYNTGNPVRGQDKSVGGNGYVNRVQASAEIVVPAIRLLNETGGTPPPPPPVSTSAPAKPPASPPASWDVYGQAKAARAQSSAATLRDLTVIASTGSAASPSADPGAPVQLHAVNQPAPSDAR